MSDIDFAELAAPFPPSDLDWRVGSKSKKGDKATLLVYLTSRAVQSRLDEVVGPARWRTGVQAIYEGPKIVGYLCSLGIEVAPGQWVDKVDGADPTDIESFKGGISGALKRAAVLWGVGRFLYDVDSKWHTIQKGYGPDDVSVYCPMGAGKDGEPGHVLIPKLADKYLPKPKAKAKKGAPIDTTPTPEDQRLADEIAAEKAKREADEAARVAKHHPSWAVDRSGWCARVQGAGMDPTLAMEVIAQASKGVRPSEMDPVRRSKATEWLVGPGMHSYDALKADRGAA